MAVLSITDTECCRYDSVRDLRWMQQDWTAGGRVTCTSSGASKRVLCCSLILLSDVWAKLCAAKPSRYYVPQNALRHVLSPEFVRTVLIRAQQVRCSYVSCHERDYVLSPRYLALERLMKKSLGVSRKVGGFFSLWIFHRHFCSWISWSRAIY